MYPPTFRKSMAWLHTWAGVVIGSLLFAIFWMGTLSVFDREIDRWMNPGTRLAPVATPLPSGELPTRLDGPVAEAAARLGAGSTQYFIRLPTDRMPVVEVRWRAPGAETFERRYLHPLTGAVLPHTDTLGGTGFIFPFHYNLHLKWMDLGYWLVGVAGMAMLLLVVSGVVIHRKIFADFFLFRPKKQLQRASLDLHNLTGVLALPFHFLIALSGLVIFMNIYWPTAPWGVFGQGAKSKEAFQAEAYGTFRRPKADLPATQAPVSLDRLRARAEQRFGAPAYFVRVWNPGDANAYIEVRRSFGDRVTMLLDNVYFDAVTGAELSAKQTPPVMAVQRFMSGMHFVQFRHWTLRWLYFAAGLAGCVLIATGFLFWLEARRASHAKKRLAGVRVVEALAVASVPGLLAATCAFFCANRLLPLDTSAFGLQRQGLEMLAFYAVWLATLAHAAMRARAAWREQAALIAVLAVAAVALNWVTTGQHLARTVSEGLWAVAGMDMLLLALAAGAGRTAVHLRRRAACALGPAARAMEAGRA
jgi:uncharacterized iron-regulated membrane protein